MSSSQDDLDLEDSSSLYSGTLSTAGAGKITPTEELNPLIAHLHSE